MTNLLERAISTDDANRASKIIQMRVLLADDRHKLSTRINRWEAPTRAQTRKGKAPARETGS